MEKANSIEFEVWGKYALFSDPLTRVGGEKFSYQIPTYEALKGIMEGIYWKPTLNWRIDSVRVMNTIQTMTKGARPVNYGGGNSLSYYTYLRDVKYQVRAHFEWNENHPELIKDRNENKHFFIAKRMLERGGRREIFLGTTECQAYVKACRFGEEVGVYDEVEELAFGLMFHGITYPNQASCEEEMNKMTARFWKPIMRRGVINFFAPKECVIKRTLGDAEGKQFDEDNFSGLQEFEGTENMEKLFGKDGEAV